MKIHLTLFISLFLTFILFCMRAEAVELYLTESGIKSGESLSAGEEAVYLGDTKEMSIQSSSSSNNSPHPNQCSIVSDTFDYSYIYSAAYSAGNWGGLPSSLTPQEMCENAPETQGFLRACNDALRIKLNACSQNIQAFRSSCKTLGTDCYVKGPICAVTNCKVKANLTSFAEKEGLSYTHCEVESHFTNNNNSRPVCASISN